MSDKIDKLKKRYIEQLMVLQGDSTNDEFALRIGICKSRLSQLRNGKGYGFSLEWIMRKLLLAGGSL